MGPHVLVDKSAIQALSANEAAVFDCLFQSVIRPVYLNEVLADLSKSAPAGRTPQDVVAKLARNTPVFHANPTASHTSLCVRELLGSPVAMTGVPVLHGGRVVKRGNGDVRIVFDRLPERDALDRWHAEDFQTVERQFAQEWRNQLQAMDLPQEAQQLLDCLNLTDQPTSYKAAAQLAHDVVASADPFTLLYVAYQTLKLPLEHWSLVRELWEKSGQPALPTYAPFTAHCFRIEVFFALAVNKGLVAQNKFSNRTDLAYLYYIPFAEVFLSNDFRFHENVAAFFMRPNQVFVRGIDLKNDLKIIENQLWQLPDKEKQEGLFRLASRPSGDGLTSKLWRTFRAAQYDDPLHEPGLAPAELGIAGDVLKVAGWPAVGPPSSTTGFDSEAEQLMITRNVPPYRGRWKTLPSSHEFYQSGGGQDARA
jgi:hypothetical protein